VKGPTKSWKLKKQLGYVILLPCNVEKEDDNDEQT
jgi:hypothetical protein